MSILSSTNSGQQKVVKELYERYGIDYDKLVFHEDQSAHYMGSLLLDASACKDGKLNLPLKITMVTGSFDCSAMGLTTLEGCPKEVGYFDCSYNQLKSLEGGPVKITAGRYRCNHNQLTSLKGAPVQGKIKEFHCSYNMLTSLEGGPEHVTEDYDYSSNPVFDDLKSTICTKQSMWSFIMQCVTKEKQRRQKNMTMMSDDTTSWQP